MKHRKLRVQNQLKNLSYQTDPRELQIVEGCRKNDRKAQKLLFDKYKDGMYTLVYRMLGDRDDAADALQEGFIETFKCIHQFKGKSSLGAWIKIIMIRKAIKKQRKVIPLASLENLGGSQEPQVISWDENLTGEYLEKAIHRLPPGYKNVFLLVEVEGYSHPEVAEMLGISSGTSKSQLYHSKKMLQKLLKELMY